VIFLPVMEIGNWKSLQKMMLYFSLIFVIKVFKPRLSYFFKKIVLLEQNSGKAHIPPFGKVLN